jgi:hypothetical protein
MDGSIVRRHRADDADPQVSATYQDASGRDALVPDRGPNVPILPSIGTSGVPTDEGATPINDPSVRRRPIRSLQSLFGVAAVPIRGQRVRCMSIDRSMERLGFHAETPPH